MILFGKLLVMHIRLFYFAVFASLLFFFSSLSLAYANQFFCPAGAGVSMSFDDEVACNSLCNTPCIPATGGVGTPGSSPHTPGSGGVSTPSPSGSGVSLPLFDPLGCDTASDSPCVVQILQRIISQLILVVYPILAGMVFYGGFQMMFARGNSEKYGAGKKTIGYAVLGFTVILVSQGIAFIIKDLISLGG